MSVQKHFLVVFTAGLCLVPIYASGGQKLTASASIVGCTDPSIHGTAVFSERMSEEGVKVVDVNVTMQGMTPGKHAVHIHEVGACVPCSSAGGHFDPGPVGYSNPDGNHPYHAGDLVNVDIGQGGTGSMHTVTSRVTVSPGPLSLFDADGSSVIIHVNPDSYCPNGVEAGCAGGARAACGVIRLD